MKADLHLHSKYSDRPTEWFLRRIGAPECFSEPERLYTLCRARGMDVFTLTDHNRIDGALAVAHLPDTFVSAELTTYFPEDGCKIHCLVYAITEAQFAELQAARENIYELQRYLREQAILHAIAHPLFRVNDRLTVAHLEKLLVLFERFELLNGTRHARAGELARSVMSHLTPELMADLATRHNLEPAGTTPWVKRFIGGSDDHGGVYPASAYTETPAGAGAQAFLAHLRAGRHAPAGVSGNSVRLAHSLYHIAYNYYRSRFLPKGGSSPLADILLRVLDGAQSAEPPRSRLLGWAARLVRRRRLKRLSPAERLLVEEFVRLRERAAPSGNEPVPGGPGAPGGERDGFALACRIGQGLGYAFVRQLAGHVAEGRIVDGLQSLAALGAVLMGVAPYFTAFGMQHKDERFLQTVADRFPAAAPQRLRSDRRAWLTDTFQDVNGVAHTIRTLGALARRAGRPLTVMTCLATPPAEAALDLVNFQPLGEFALPEYEAQQMAFPPFLEVVEHLERTGVYEVILSTPGPMGLTGLLAARLLGLRTVGIYHTDFPKYVACLTQDEQLSQATWRYMQWFYGQLDMVYVPSACYRRELLDRGFAESRLRVLPRGVDLERFSPARRDLRFWERFGMNGNAKLLYVGRVSREKNVHLLLDAFRLVRAAEPNVDLVIVGDGPERSALEAQAGDAHVVFTGVLRGDDLARAYAGADLFVFPSTTDTFGNVVLEAHASGLPAVVSTEGGPAELVGRHGAGVAVGVRAAADFGAAICALLRDPARRAEMARRALETAREHSWERVLEQF